jgi:hypothetical protein
MKTIVIICIPIIILTILANKEILPPKLYAFLMGLILLLGIMSIGSQLIDISSRDNMNWDEYYWYFNKDKAPSDTTIGDITNPWEKNSLSLTCIGSACCYEGSTYDSTQNICVPDESNLKVLEKYGCTQNKATTLNNNFSPLFSSLSKF